MRQLRALVDRSEREISARVFRLLLTPQSANKSSLAVPGPHWGRLFFIDTVAARFMGTGASNCSRCGRTMGTRRLYTHDR